MSRWQENRDDVVMGAATRAKVRWRPDDIGISASELRSIIRELPRFVVETALPYSVINERTLSRSEMESLTKGLV